MVSPLFRIWRPIVSAARYGISIDTCRVICLSLLLPFHYSAACLYWYINQARAKLAFTLLARVVWPRATFIFSTDNYLVAKQQQNIFVMVYPTSRKVAAIKNLALRSIMKNKPKLIENAQKVFVLNTGSKYTTSNRAAKVSFLLGSKLIDAPLYLTRQELLQRSREKELQLKLDKLYTGKKFNDVFELPDNFFAELSEAITGCYVTSRPDCNQYHLTRSLQKNKTYYNNLVFLDTKQNVVIKYVKDQDALVMEQLCNSLEKQYVCELYPLQLPCLGFKLYGVVLKYLPGVRLTELSALQLQANFFKIVYAFQKHTKNFLKNHVFVDKCIVNRLCRDVLFDLKKIKFILLILKML
ncbi:orf5 [Sucra jujuba nucleopolyhedrovirus]|uniref:Orf5 n=1 Tax=Sucra jujuba nucleopolyhedrovirus TaxID=1563660 RepID=A0A097P8X0_9ABAC|nr:orf5 [Sucra jujuba nucleopolyhedrovirus]AIU41244.1 orf5 [Sucra jujuba nucleopolyhedrovirus]